MTSETMTAAEIFERVYSANFTRLCHFVNRHANDWQLSEDMAQETFAYFWAQLDAGKAFEDIDRLFPLLARIAHRRLRDHWRKASVARELLSGTPHNSDSREVPVEVSEADAGLNPVDVAEQVTNRVNIGAALAMLPSKQRRAVALRLVEDMPLAEVAAETGYAERTIRLHYEQGISALRESFGVAERPVEDVKDRRERARKAFFDSVEAGSPMTYAALATAFGLTPSWARIVINEVGSYQRPESAHDRVTASVLAGLLGGHWAPGHQLNSDALAQQYGVSNALVCKVLRELADDGRLETRPRPGHNGNHYLVPGQPTARHLRAVA